MSDVQIDSIAHQPLTALEQWKASRHRSLWVTVGICTVFKWITPSTTMKVHKKFDAKFFF